MSTTTTPIASEAEVRILGSAISSYDWASRMAHELSGAHFHDPRNREIFAIIQDRVQKDKVVDQGIVFELAQPKGVDAGYLAGLFVMSNRSLDIDELIKEIKMAHKKRVLQEFFRMAATEIGDAKLNFESFVAKHEEHYFGIMNDGVASTFVDMADWVTKPQDFSAILQDRQQRHMDGTFSFDGQPTHYLDLDNHLKGLCNGHLIICGARPGVGKTSLALNLIENLTIKNKAKCLLFSLEMPSSEICEKLIAQTADFSFRKMKDGNFSGPEFQQLYRAIQLWKEHAFIIDDQSSLSIDKIHSRAIRAKRAHGINCILIDYVQLVTAPNDKESRHLEIGAISRKLKEIAKSLDVPVFALAQLNREIEKRTEKKPLLSDLRESGSLEADADAVLLLHRPDMILATDRPGIMQIHIAKNRFGPTGLIELAYNKESGKLNNYAKYSVVEDIRKIVSEQNPTWDRFSPD